MSAVAVANKPIEQRVAEAYLRIETLEAEFRTVTIGGLLRERAGTHASTLAINIFERGECLTYAQLDHESNRYAHALQGFGVRKGDRIGVMLPNRIEFFIVFFAIAKLGGVMVPVNMRFTPREIEYVLSDTQATFAIVDETVMAAFSAMDCWPDSLEKQKIIGVGQPFSTSGALLSALLNGAPESTVDVAAAPDDLAVIAHTSGTTGFPKGCMLTHEWFAVSAYDWAHFDSCPYSRYLCWSPFFYILGPMQLLKCFYQGGTLYQAQQLSSSKFAEWIEDYAIESCLLPEFIARHVSRDAVKSLKQVTCSLGWSVEAIREFRMKFNIRAANIYGMAEIGMGSAFIGDVPEMEEAGSLGHRAMFRQMQLVNEDGGPTPIGEVGELWVKGRGLFSGYWNKPEANAAQFDGEWFKTGDLMRRNELGYYWFVGRKKDMIRRSNENIAASEVEAIVREISEVADVAAVPVVDARRGEEVKIVVELKSGFQSSEWLVKRIVEHARGRLAAFKVPRYIAFTPKLPRNSSEKIVKRDLVNVPDPLAGAYDSEEGHWR
ncbi:long-chain fatty acid--CoA ligase [Bradyrhizobium brasilense]|uniref:class I adenylate-forming enzyme family protein n=1 Tax=Bradyrhizobium brasilense TaxID=1419277 RepID=UPI001456F82D|nr:class I adenylate-forming enzyme family protein [Bradyrhizobium brasilense]NLS75305.1 long-chain fatty acid--CoA ligase [Bradyrhizobium brasilense]